MKLPLLIGFLIALLLLAVAGFGVLFYLGARNPNLLAGQPEPAPTAARAADPSLATSGSAAMQLNAPGVQPTRQNLDDIQRAREDLSEAAGEDGPERY